MRKLGLSLLFLYAMTFMFPLNGSAQQIIIPYPEKRINLHLEKATMILVAMTLAAEENVPVGLQLSSSDNNESNIDIDVKDALLSDVLNKIVQQTKVYGWEYRDGVINFYPTRDSDSFFAKLLDTRIARFKPSSNDKFVIRDSLLNAAEIKQLMSEERVTAERLTYPYRPSIYANNANLSAEYINVRTLLNKIIRESEHNFYLLRWTQKEKREFSIGF